MSERTEGPSDTPLTNLFHEHLDVCKQCRDNPFDLCLIGSRLLISAGLECSQKLAGIFGR